MTFEIEQFKHLTKASCETMLGWTVEQLDRRPSPAPEEPTVRSWVSLSGAFSGVLSMECSVSLAERAAAAMLGDVEASSLSTDEVHDCFGELANILGGNVK
ncbi:MAG: chemotaxis protein CheX [Myxococcota bacterium]